MDIKSQRLANLLLAIQKETISYKQLINASSNVFIKAEDSNDPEIDFVLCEIEKIKWGRFTKETKRASSTVRGKQHEEIKEKLQTTLDAASERFDLSSNRLLTKVKIGGDMIGGRALTDIYISYKNNDGEACVLGAYQQDGSSLLVWRFRPYKKSNNDHQVDYQNFDYQKHSEASDIFLEHLSKIAPQNNQS